MNLTAAACRVRQLFSSVYSDDGPPRRAGRKWSANELRMIPEPASSQEVPRRQCTPGSVAAADQPGGSVGSFGRLMIRRRGPGDRTS